MNLSVFDLAYSKVNEVRTSGVVVFVDHDVLRLHITVDDITRVCVCHGFHHVLEERQGIIESQVVDDLIQ